MNSFKGLSNKQVEESRRKFGANTLTPPKRESWWLLLLSKFKDPLIIVLSIAALISVVISLSFGRGSLLESSGIILAIILATLVSFINEWKAGKEFDILNKINDESLVKVIRTDDTGNSKVTQVSKSDIVVGDYVILQIGDEVPADGKVVEAVDLKIDESSLNGESKPSSKTATHVETYSTAYSPNKLYRGTAVSLGEGVMCVEAVGDATEIGKTARSASEVTGVVTPLSKQLGKLGANIGKIGVSVSILVFIALFVYEWHHGGISLSTQEGLSQIITMFMFVVTLIVMAVPEGLPMSISLALAYSMRKMTSQNTLVRKMHACETMGAATVICTDKTGTLTQNKMKVAYCTFSKADEFAKAASVNSTAYLDGTNVIGNNTEGALLLHMKDLGYTYTDVRQAYTVLERIPFSSSLKYMATAVAGGEGKAIYVKGSPETILTFCTLPSEQVAEQLKQISAYQQRGMRCIAFCHRQFNTYEGKLSDNLSAMQYDGFVAIEDPVREDVPAAIKKCEEAGIAIKIITGDNTLTAIEIARQSTLWKESDTIEKNSITGPEFSAMSDEQLLSRIPDIKVMSRAKPEDKMRLVKLLEQMGEVVAVTGDGTNDAPALNYANVGLSMGSGTSVAKESSDIIILDDSFSTVVSAVEWGRSIYRNIQRFIYFQLSVNVAALLTAIAGPLVLKEEYPLTIIQILWINLIMDTLAAIALASEPKDPKVMKDAPRAIGDSIITWDMGIKILVTGVGMFLAAILYMFIDRHSPGSPGYSKFLCIFFTGFVMMQMWNLLNARVMGTDRWFFSRIFSNKNFIAVFLLIFLLQVLIVEIMPGELFRTVQLDFLVWLKIILLTSFVLILGQALRLLKKHK